MAAIAVGKIGGPSTYQEPSGQLAGLASAGSGADRTSRPRSTSGRARMGSPPSAALSAAPRVCARSARGVNPPILEDARGVPVSCRLQSVNADLDHRSASQLGDVLHPELRHVAEACSSEGTQQRNPVFRVLALRDRRLAPVVAGSLAARLLACGPAVLR